MAKDNDWEDVPAPKQASGSDSDWEDVSHPGQPADISELESLARGGAEGLTLGFAPQIAGVGGALADAMAGHTDDLLDSYRKNRDESKANFKAANEAHPGYSLAGNIAGSIVPGVLSGGLGEVAEGATALDKLRRAGQIGGAYGALTGVANSDHDLTKGDIDGNLHDALVGGAQGAITGGLIHTAGSALGGLGELAKKTKMGKILANAYNLGADGTNIISDAGQKALKQDASIGTANTINQMVFDPSNPNSLRSVVGKELGSILRSAKGTSDPKKIYDIVLNHINQLDDNIEEQALDKKKLLNYFNTKILGEETPLKIRTGEVVPEQTVTKSATPSTEEELKQKMMKLQMDRDQFPGSNPNQRDIGDVNIGPNEEGKNVVQGIENSGSPLGDNQLSLVRKIGPDGKPYIAIQDPDGGKLVAGGFKPDLPGMPETTETIPASLENEKYQDVPVRLNPPTEIPDRLLYSMKKTAQNYSKFGKGLQSPNGQGLVGKIAGDLGDVLEAGNPGLEEANTNYKNLAEAKQELLKGADPTLHDGANANDKLGSVIKRLGENSEVGTKADTSFQRAMDSLELVNPGTKDVVEGLAKKGGLDYQTAKAASNATFGHGPFGWAKSLATGIGANGLGLTVGKANKAFTSFTKEQLGALAQKLQASGGETYQKLGNVLSEAANRNEIGKNALIFSLMQNPSYRELMNHMVGEGDPNQ